MSTTFADRAGFPLLGPARVTQGAVGGTGAGLQRQKSVVDEAATHGTFWLGTPERFGRQLNTGLLVTLRRWRGA